jgi:hypothetical protein
MVIKHSEISILKACPVCIQIDSLNLSITYFSTDRLQPLQEKSYPVYLPRDQFSNNREANRLVSHFVVHSVWPMVLSGERQGVGTKRF